MECLLGLGLFTALFALCCIVGYLGRALGFVPPARPGNSRQYWD